VADEIGVDDDKLIVAILRVKDSIPLVETLRRHMDQLLTIEERMSYHVMRALDSKFAEHGKNKKIK
jgi:hypothetical protein